MFLGGWGVCFCRLGSYVGPFCSTFKSVTWDNLNGVVKAAEWISDWYLKFDWNTALRSFGKDYWSGLGLVVAIDDLDRLQLPWSVSISDYDGIEKLEWVAFYLFFHSINISKNTVPLRWRVFTSYYVDVTSDETKFLYLLFMI